MEPSTEADEERKSPAFRYPVWLAVTGLILGLSVEVLFDGHALGISFPIWSALCVLALLGMAAREGVRLTWPETGSAIVVLFFSILTALRLEPLTVFLDIVLTLAIFAIWVRTFRDEKLLNFGWLDFGWTFIIVPLEAWIRPWPVAQTAWRQALGERGERSQFMALLRGVLFTLPILVVFVALLVSADLVFADYVENALRWFDLERIVDWIRRALIVIVCGIFFLGALVSALRERKGEPMISVRQPILSPFIGFVESMVVLGAVDLLFVGFVAIQFAYLFGGQENITTAGYTYSEYARRGFGELVVVAFLSLGLIMALGTWAKRQEKRHNTWFNGLSGGLVGLIGVILISALKRLLLYENAYGFTRLRTYTHVAIYWMGLLFVVFLVLLIMGHLRRFALTAAICTVGFVATVNLLNVDAFITARNTTRLEESGEIDVDYLSTLSNDATPGLIDLAQGSPGWVRSELLPYLACRQAMLSDREATVSWQSYHLSHVKAQKLLSTIDDDLGAYQVELTDRGWIVSGPDGEQSCFWIRD
ncbi:MAG: hypothetical protein AMJ88_06225 [Anaerolineae bacterium SM23_ 63]|nr:MAG: hypothetical protein AMJ88_06225 [Anaerolineae bacterium SM23_ 63]